MSKKLKLCLALILSLAVLAQYSFSPQALYAYGLDNTENAVQTEETVADEQNATEAAASTDATDPTEATKSAEENKASDDGNEADKQDVTYPAAKFSETAGDVKVNISAPEGALPEGTTVEVASVKASKVQDAVDNLIDDGKIIKAVDITFKDKDGKEIEPNEKVSVTFESKAFGKLDGASVVHIQDNGKAEAVKGGNVDGNKATFKSDEFSVYVVVETGEDARLSVVFHQARGNTVTIKVKKADLNPDMIDTLVYDPGAGDVSGLVFAGWTTDEEYDTDTEAKTIDGVRDIVRTELNKSYNDGDVLDIYAMLFKQFDITYLDTYGTSLGSNVVKFPASSSETWYSYKINMTYEPEDNNHNFEGWWVAEGGSNIAGFDPNDNEGKGTLYQHEQTISIKGDVVFSVNAPEGRWLIFNENGKGATYNAPKFLETGEVTEKPCDDDDMLRHGYTFGGWYNGTEDEEGNITLTTPFVFGGTISDHTTIYAKWNPVKNAKYTVIFWTQNSKSIGKKTLNPDEDYDLKASTVVDGGEVGEPIPYKIVDNGAEDYATIGGEDFHYTGFCAKAPSASVDVTAEGDAVLNIYYDRIQYNLRFYLYREQVGGGNNRFTYANNSAAGQNVWGIVNWHPAVNANNVPTTTYGDVLASDNIDGYIGHYFVLQAFYGEDISKKWPSYDQIQGPTANPNPVSYVMMNGTGLKPNPSSGGDGTVKGVITVMDDKILGATDEVDGNFLIVRFQQTYNNWRYHIMYETAEGGAYEEASAPISPIVSRSSNTNINQQTPPQYDGFEFVNKTYEGEQNRVHHANFYYDRLKYKVNFMDGIYVNGNNATVKVKTDNELSQSSDIAYGATIPDSVKNYVPDLPEGEAGYVFEGWYVDKACNTEYDFGTMPIGGVTVYAKWREIQYRVFLHPQAGKDPTLDWGNDSVAMSFRVSYGGRVSTPTGVRSGYEFGGWYWDEACKNGFNSKAFVLNEETVPSSPAYDKTTDFTDKMDKWGNVSGDSEHVGPWNSDLTGYKGGDRFWITKKLDLYAKWRSVAEGSKGITVVYDAVDGHFDGADQPSTRTDDHLYVDQAEAIGGTASIPNADNKYFLYWVLQEWNKDTGKYEDTDTTVLPSEDYTVLLSNAEPDVKKWVNPMDEDDYVVPADKHSLTPPEGDTIHTKIGEATYTVKLRAEYAEREKPTQTHIIWYANGGTGGDGGFVLDPINRELKVNEEVNIRPATTFTRDGYEFVGWAKKEFDPSTNPPLMPDGKTINKDAFSEDDTLSAWLSWNGSNFTYKKSESEPTATATQIAADEIIPYEELYAVWKEKGKISVTVEHYLLGTETKIADNTSVKVTEGDELDPATVEPATTFLPAYQAYTFTKDSTVPSEAFVVDETGMIVKLYYTLPLTITAETKSKTYDATPLAGEYTADGALADDKAGIEEQLAGATPPEITNVEDSPFKYEAPAVEVPSYYVVETKDGNLTINPAPLTISADNKSKQQGQADPELTATVTGLKGSDKAPKYSLSRVAGEDPGKYAIIVSNVTASGIKVGNYDVTTKNGTLTITGTTPVPPTPPTPPPGGPVVTGGPAPAAPATIVDTPTPTTIVDEPAPKAVEAYWALINLLCAIATALLSLIMLIRYFGKRTYEEEVMDPATGERVTRDVDEQRKGLARIASLIPAIGGIIAFILTEDMSLPMTMVDKWTVLMVVILAIQAGVGIFAKLRDKDEEEEDDEAMA